jgi:hypothetical protein
MVHKVEFPPQSEIIFHAKYMVYTMEENRSEEKIKGKNKGGRKPKKETEKALYKVGGFRLNATEKAIYDKLFQATGLGNHTEFFRKVLFKGKLKLYYTDISTERIYNALLRIEKEIKKNGSNYNQVVKRVHTLSTDEQILQSLSELQNISIQTEHKLREIIRLFDQLPAYTKESSSPGNNLAYGG